MQCCSRYTTTEFMTILWRSNTVWRQNCIRSTFLTYWLLHHRRRMRSWHGRRGKSCRSRPQNMTLVHTAGSGHHGSRVVVGYCCISRIRKGSLPFRWRRKVWSWSNDWISGIMMQLLKCWNWTMMTKMSIGTSLSDNEWSTRKTLPLASSY